MLLTTSRRCCHTDVRIWKCQSSCSSTTSTAPPLSNSTSVRYIFFTYKTFSTSCDKAFLLIVHNHSYCLPSTLYFTVSLIYVSAWYRSQSVSCAAYISSIVVYYLIEFPFFIIPAGFYLNFKVWYSEWNSLYITGCSVTLWISVFLLPVPDAVQLGCHHPVLWRHSDWHRPLLLDIHVVDRGHPENYPEEKGRW